MRLLLSTIFIFIVKCQVILTINLKLDDRLQVVKNENGMITVGLKPEAQLQTQPRLFQWQQFFGLMPQTSLTQTSKSVLKPEVDRTHMTVPATVTSSVQGSDRELKAGNAGTKIPAIDVKPERPVNDQQTSSDSLNKISEKNPTPITENDAKSIGGNNGIQTGEENQPPINGNPADQPQKVAHGEENSLVLNGKLEMLVINPPIPSDNVILNGGKPEGPINEQPTPSENGILNGKLEMPVINPPIPSDNVILNGGKPEGPINEQPTPSENGILNGGKLVIPAINPPIPSDNEILNEGKPEVPVNEQPTSSENGILNDRKTEGSLNEQPIPIDNGILNEGKLVMPVINPLIPSENGILNDRATEMPINAPLTSSDSVILNDGKPEVFVNEQSIPSDDEILNGGKPEVPVNVPLTPSDDEILNGGKPVTPYDLPTPNDNGMQINPLLQLFPQLLISSLTKSTSESHSFSKQEANLNLQQLNQPQFELETLRPTFTQAQPMTLNDPSPFTGNGQLTIPEIDATSMFEPELQPQPRLQSPQLLRFQPQLEPKPESEPQLLPYLLLASILKSTSNSVSKQGAKLSLNPLTQPQFSEEGQIPSIMRMQPKIDDDTNFAINSIKIPTSVVNPILPPILKAFKQLSQLICYGVARNEILNRNGAFNNGLSKLCDENRWLAPKIPSQGDLIKSLLLNRLRKI